MKKIIQHFDLYPVWVDSHTNVVVLPQDLLFLDKKIERISILTADYMPVFNTGEKLVPDTYLKHVYFNLFDAGKNPKMRNLAAEFLRINSNIGLNINSKLDFSRCTMKVMHNEILEPGENYILPVLVYYSDRPKQPFTEPSNSLLLEVPVVPERCFYRLSDFGGYALVGKQIARIQASGLTNADG